MSANRKRKIYDKGRVFNSEWCPKYLVVPHNQGVVCLVCQNTIEVMKEYNAKRHHTTTKHCSQFDEILGQSPVDKIEHLSTSIKKQQGVFTGYKKDSELVAMVSIKSCESMAKKESLSVEGEFIKHCLAIFTENAWPGKKHLVEQTSFSRFTV